MSKIDLCSKKGQNAFLWMEEGMKFPWHVMKLECGCIAQEKKFSRSEIRTHSPRMKSRPQIIFNGLRWLSARLSYSLNVREIGCNPDLKGDQLVLHTCDNEWCINPDHLYLGTQQQNCHDRSKRNGNWLEGRKSCHTDEGRARISAALRLRKGEKRANTFWTTEQGKAEISRISKEGWAKNREARAAKAKKFWSSPEGRALASNRSRNSWAKLSPEERANRSAKMHAGRYGKK